MKKLYTLIIILWVAFSSQAQVVISQVYGGGGNTGATFTNDFIELFNRGTVAQDLTGWSVQYASSTGTTWAVTNLTNVTLAPGKYYLIQHKIITDVNDAVLVNAGFEKNIFGTYYLKSIF